MSHIAFAFQVLPDAESIDKTIEFPQGFVPYIPTCGETVIYRKGGAVVYGIVLSRAIVFSDLRNGEDGQIISFIIEPKPMVGPAPVIEWPSA